MAETAARCLSTWTRVKRQVRKIRNEWGWVIAFALLNACASTPSDLEASRPPCTWKLWAGDPVRSAVVRRQDNAVLKCDEPDFDNMTCLTNEDLANLLTCGGK